MRAEHAKIVSASERSAKTLERTELQLDSLKTTHAELEKKYAESQASVSNLSRQVEKWANLEDRENADLEKLRKSRIELEVKVKQLETEKEELDKKMEEESAKVEKYKGKIDKYKEVLQAHAVGWSVWISSIL